MTRPIVTTAELHTALRKIVVQELEIEADELVESASFEEEYEADSLSLLAIVARFERELGIVVPADEVGRMTTFDNIVALVDEIRAQDSGTAGGA